MVATAVVHERNILNMNFQKAGLTFRIQLFILLIIWYITTIFSKFRSERIELYWRQSVIFLCHFVLLSFRGARPGFGGFSCCCCCSKQNSAASCGLKSSGIPKQQLQRTNTQNQRRYIVEYQMSDLKKINYLLGFYIYMRYYIYVTIIFLLF